jgi:hypothetical protein
MLMDKILMKLLPVIYIFNMTDPTKMAAVAILEFAKRRFLTILLLAECWMAYVNKIVDFQDGNCHCFGFSEVAF